MTAFKEGDKVVVVKKSDPDCPLIKPVYPDTETMMVRKAVDGYSFCTWNKGSELHGYAFHNSALRSL